jgi:hypothetical protein
MGNFQDFFLISSPLFLFLAWWPSWLEVGITGHTFEMVPSKDHSSKVLLQLAQWFLRRGFLCEFPIKRGDEIWKKSSPQKPLGQLQQNFG